MECEYRLNAYILQLYCAVYCVISVWANVFARAFPYPSPFFNAGESAIRRDDREIGKVGVVIALTFNEISCQMLERIMAVVTVVYLSE